MKKHKILIVDDSEMNRALLADILEEKYQVVEAENGMQAIDILVENETDFWFVLLDIMMPEMNGFELMDYINRHHWNDRVVVIMITSDDSTENASRAFNMGAFDYISRPFNPQIVHKRLSNTLLLYSRQHDLEKTVKEQYHEQQKSNDMMLSILSHIVEFRNGESGLHIQHVKKITGLLLQQLLQITDQYPLTAEDISLITMASAVHDVGKISIPEEILNKPGKLTQEEFEIMKSHSDIGSKMIADLPPQYHNSALTNFVYEICRWHHERYDGRGYPDGLKGEDIPISAQVVSIADVYDALTSVRCYKKAFSHEQALEMILEGQCGVFNPLLLQCMNEISDKLKNIDEHIDADTDMQEAVKVKEKGSKISYQKKQEMILNQSEYMKVLYVDPLTKVYNRRYYDEYVYNLPSVEAVAYIDVDNLEKINTDYGWEVGDLVLQQTAQNILSRIRRSDYLIRYGGDEFLIVFSSMMKETLDFRLEEILCSFDTLTLKGYPKLHISVSVGAVYGAQSVDELFDKVSDLLDHSQYKKNQVNICFLDEKEDADGIKNV